MKSRTEMVCRQISPISTGWFPLWGGEKLKKGSANGWFCFDQPSVPAWMLCVVMVTPCSLSAPRGSWQGVRHCPSLHVGSDALPVVFAIKGNLQEIPVAWDGKQTASTSYVIFSSIWLVPEYPRVPGDLQLSSDSGFCRRWLMNMRFQGRSLSVTWDLCRDSDYTSSLPPHLLQQEYESPAEGLLYL